MGEKNVDKTKSPQFPANFLFLREGKVEDLENRGKDKDSR